MVEYMTEKKPLNIGIGKRVRIAREAAGLTREYLAECLDITPRFVADVERGSVCFSVPNLIKLCEVLHVSSDFILWGYPENRISIDDRLKGVDRECLAIIDKMVQNQIELIEIVKKNNKINTREG